MNKRYDELFRDIVTVLRRDWAGKDLLGDRLDPRYYNTAVGQAWHDAKLDELLFLRYVNQMLAGTGDRHLRFERRPAPDYEPWCCGFFTRRCGNALFVTALRGEDRVRPGDRITAINGGTPAQHRERIQKNFFYADEPEREDWNGLLKMADTIDVEHAGGARETLPLGRHPLLPNEKKPVLHRRNDGVILDLRNVPDIAEEELLALLPEVCRRDTPLGELLDTEFLVNYTPLNSALRAAGLADRPEAEEYRRELREKAGRGFLPETAYDDTVVEGRAVGPVVVLTDTWTRDGAETLALAARRAGAALIGRPTLGTAELGGDVSISLDDRYVLTWPTLITKAAAEGKTLPGRGLAPDILIPWTPEELQCDLLLARAENEIEKT